MQRASIALLTLPPLLFLALHLRTLDYEFVWMDQVEIVEGEIILPPGSLARAFRQPLHSRQVAGLGELRNPYYRPLQIVLASVIHDRLGARPRAFRMASLGAGFLAVAIFTALAWLLVRSVPAAAWAGCFAAAHPVAIESCVWISGIAEPLCAVFVLSSLGLALLWVRVPRRSQRLGLGLLSLTALVCALLSKEKGVVTPALLLAAGIAGAAGHGQRPSLRRWAVPLLAQGSIVAAYLLAWRPLALGPALGLASPIGGRVTTHVASALANWPGNLAWLFLPFQSNASDSVRVVGSPLDPGSALGLGLALASLGAFAWLSRRGLGVAAFALAWIWIAYLPSANLLPQIHAQGERYLYLSSFGAALLLADGLPRLLRADASRARYALAACTGVALIGFLAQRTWVRTPAWQTPFALFVGDTQRDPYFREGRYHLAQAFFAERRFAAADAQLEWLLSEEAVRSERWSYVNQIGVYQLACETHLARGQAGRALELWGSLEARQPEIARLPSLQTCRGQALQALGEHAQAVALLIAVANELSDAPPARLSLRIASSLVRLGRADEARDWLAQAEANASPEPDVVFEIGRVRQLLRRARARGATD